MSELAVRTLTGLILIVAALLVAFQGGYPYAQVYAPDDDDVIAFEPMTAPTNALAGGGAELPMASPGEAYRATFSVTVADLGG